MNAEDTEFYGAYALPLQQAGQQLVDHLQEMLNAISTDPELRPAEYLTHRLKSAESLRRKLQKQGLPCDVPTALRELHDVIGARVVVHFIGDVYELLDAIEASPFWQVHEVKDYIGHPKPNGYRSLHILLAVPFSAPGFDRLLVEVQLRTIAMDCWASLEHQLRYKKQVAHAPLIEAELSRCAAEMASTDLTLQAIRELIMKENDT